MLVTCHKCFCFYCFDPDILGKYSCDKCDKLLYWIFVGDCRSKSVVGWGDGGEWKSKHNMLITLFIKRPTHQCQINASALTGGGKGGFLVCSFAWAGRWMCHLKMAAWCSKCKCEPCYRTVFVSAFYWRSANITIWSSAPFIGGRPDVFSTNINRGRQSSNASA